MTDDQQSPAPEKSAGGPATGEAEPAGPAERPEPSRTPLFERILALFRGGKAASSLREDLEDALSEATDGEAAFTPAERAMLNNILRLREVRVEDVMVPRADVQAIEISTTLGRLLSLFEQSGHSRMPVYSDTLDDPRGMIHIRDVVGHITRTARTAQGPPPPAGPAPESPDPAHTDLARLDLARVDLARQVGELELIRPVLFVPASMMASDLMARMQAAHIQIALVIDEYGGTDGLVSLEDIVETVVGDIEDEHDEDEALITKVGDGVFIVDAKAEIDEVAAAIGDAFKAGEHGDYVDTIGGMIFNELGRVPLRGEVVQAVPGFEFHVLDADPRRVKRVRIQQVRTGERRRRAVREPAADI